MKLSDIIEESIFCSIGCITKESDIETLQSYLLYNKDAISKFRTIIVAHTKTENISDELFDKYNNVWNQIIGSVKIIKRPNHGHTFGFVDLDKTVLDYAKQLEFGNKWIVKSTNDVLLTPELLNLEMEDSEFFFIQGHGYTGMDTYYKLDSNKAVENFKDNGYEYFFPQTNFFIIKSSIDYLIDPSYFTELYTKCINDPDYLINKTQTEYKYLLCECVLRDCVVRNKLKCKHLLSKEVYKQLLDIIIMYRISDSSHKNIFFKEIGLCHYHFKDQDIIEI
jgi:hypothetical protein